MDRPEKIACFSLLLTVSMTLAEAAPTVTVARTETVIYKHVDENGRVSYANSPIKGGARVELEPLTVIPSTPSGSLNSANAQYVARSVSTQAASVPSSALQNTPSPSQINSRANTAAASVLASVSLAAPGSKPAIQVASVLPLSSQTQATAKPIENDRAPDNNLVAALETQQQIIQQRRAETRRRLLEGELQTEEQLLVSAKTKLTEEQSISGSIRAMRAAFSATAEVATLQKPLINPETRAEIERHFERVRNLQDQVAMHENHLQTLRDQVANLK